LIAIDSGGSYDTHPQIPSLNIIEDLNQNLKQFKVEHKVKIIQGLSTDPYVLDKCEQLLNGQKFDMIFIDSDGLVGRDIEVFEKFFHKVVYLILDDYEQIGGDPYGKSETVKEWVMTNINNKKLKEIAVLEWATWFGIYRK
jgi:hypothetical protein